MSSEKSFRVSAWSGGNGGLGFSISKKDRAIFFPQHVKKITLHMPRLKEPIIKDLSNKKGFWNKCPELENVETKNWLIKSGYEKGGKRWAKGNPPKFILTEISQGVFNLIEE